MDKKLFGEKYLSKAIPQKLREHIENAFAPIDCGLFDIILQSEELKIFKESIKIPKITANKKECKLMDEMKGRIKIKADKKHKN